MVIANAEVRRSVRPERLASWDAASPIVFALWNTRPSRVRTWSAPIQKSRPAAAGFEALARASNPGNFSAAPPPPRKLVSRVRSSISATSTSNGIPALASRLRRASLRDARTRRWFEFQNFGEVQHSMSFSCLRNEFQSMLAEEIEDRRGRFLDRASADVYGRPTFFSEEPARSQRFPRRRQSDPHIPSAGAHSGKVGGFDEFE